jgi:type I restriction enzyme R subunit
LPLDNINVRPHRQEIETLSREWLSLDETRFQHLNRTIAPPLRYYGPTRLVEIQFRVLVERLTTAWLAGRTDEVARFAEQVRAALCELADNIAEVQVVAEHRTWVLSEGFWAHLDYDRLRELQDTFAPLMRFRQRQKREMVSLNLPDRIASRRWIIFGPSGEGAFADTYRERVEAHVRRLAEQLPALGKLKQGMPLDEEDLGEIAHALNQADLFITEEVLREVYRQPAASLPDFLRHILKLARLPRWEDRIKAEFDRFIAAHGFMSANERQSD